MIDKSDVVYRSLQDPFDQGILSCGFMKKPTMISSQKDFTIDYYSCFLVLSGTGTYQDFNHPQIKLESGDFVQRLPHVTHSTMIKPDGSWVEFYISFGKPVYDYMCQLSLLDPSKPVIKGGSSPTPLQLASFSTFLAQLKDASSKDLPELLLTAQKLVLRMQDFSLSTQSSIPKIISKKDQIEVACDHLSTYFHKDIDYRKLAASLYMSYETFRKHFKLVTGVSPMKYRTIKKMEQAKYMLQSGLSIKEVATLTGYSDVFAFTKQFKKSIGISPGRYINQ